MNKTLKRLFWAAILVPSVVAADGYKVSILPRFYPERLTAMMSPLVDYLKEQTGKDFKLVLTKNFEDYENRLNSGEIEVGYENPLVYTRVAARQEVVAMAVDREGGDGFRGIVITRPDSGIRSLADLRGKRVMIVGETSAGGFLSQKLSLLEAGIPVAEIEMESAADNRQENVIIAVSIGDADAGFIRESALHVADKYIAPGSIEMVVETAWLPNWAFSVDRQLPTDIKNAIAAAVLKLDDAAHPALKAMELVSFKPATDSDYDSIRRALRD